MFEGGPFCFIGSVTIESDDSDRRHSNEFHDHDYSHDEGSEGDEFLQFEGKGDCNVQSPDLMTDGFERDHFRSPSLSESASSIEEILASHGTIVDDNISFEEGAGINDKDFSLLSSWKMPASSTNAMTERLDIATDDITHHEGSKHSLPMLGLQFLCSQFGVPVDGNTESLTIKLLFTAGEFVQQKSLHNDRNLSFLALTSNFQTNFHERKEYLEHERISAGGFGVVWKVKHKHDSKEYAIKQVVIKQEDRELVMKEVKILADLDHPNIVRYYDSWVEKLQKETNMFPRFGHKLPLDEDGEVIFCANSAASQSSLSEELKTPHDADYLFIKMELCEGTLDDCLIARANRDGGAEISRKERVEALHFFSQILDGVMFCHQKKNVIHRDIKPQNLFYTIQADGTKRFKLGDFGLAKILLYSATPASLNEEMSTEIGTVTYAAPEQKEMSSYSYSADVYSLGLVFFEMLNNFSTKFEKLQAFKALKQDRKLMGSFQEDSLEGQWILSMTQKDPLARPGLGDVAKTIKWLEMIYTATPSFLYSSSIMRIPSASSSFHSNSSLEQGSLLGTMFAELESVKREKQALDDCLREERMDHERQLDELKESNFELEIENESLRRQLDELSMALSKAI
eukprot:m.130268 g.130268  ORF g.130268 m.130268 type:complete len:628 (+) comp9467_c0_seq21:4471-6354(+)